MGNTVLHGVLGSNEFVPKLTELLDACVVLTSPLNSAASGLTKKYHVALYGQISFKGSRIIMHAFFPRHFLPDPDEATFVQLSNAKDLGSVYMVETRIENAGMMEFLKSACDIPSSIVFSPRIVNGRFEVTLLFNHTVTGDVSDLITTLSESGSDASITRLGKPADILQALTEISREIPLSFLELSLEMPAGKGITEEQKTIGKKWLRVIKYNMPGDRQRFLYLSPDDVSPGSGNKITRVHESLPLYETEESDPLLMDLESEISKLMIPRFGAARLMKDGRDTIGIVTMPAFIGKYIQCLYAFRKKYPGFSFTIMQLYGIESPA